MWTSKGKATNRRLAGPVIAGLCTGVCVFMWCLMHAVLCTHRSAHAPPNTVDLRLIPWTSQLSLRQDLCSRPGKMHPTNLPQSQNTRGSASHLIQFLASSQTAVAFQGRSHGATGCGTATSIPRGELVKRGTATGANFMAAHRFPSPGSHNKQVKEWLVGTTIHQAAARQNKAHGTNVKSTAQQPQLGRSRPGCRGGF